MSVRSGSVAMALVVVVVGCSDATETVPSSQPTDAPGVATTVVPTTSTAAATSTTGAISTSSTVAPTETTTTTVPPSATAGWDTWTLIYTSLPTGEHTRADAQLVAATLEGGSVLQSDDYPSLNAGYWVVHAGEWRDRQTAGVWCPQSLDPGLSCYPRYLGPDIAQLLREGAAIAEVDARLVVLDPASGETLATFSGAFHPEEFPSYFNLAADSSELFYGLGWEDSWYWCEADQGQIRRLDLGSGIADIFGDGWSPAVSPDGRWLAVVAAEQCYPDPEYAGWVVTPGSQIEVFDLTSESTRPAYVLRPSVAPISYDDEQGVRGVRWDPAAPDDLLVWLADDSVRRISYDSDADLATAPVEFATGGVNLAAVTADRAYFVSFEDSTSTVRTVDRGNGEVVDTVTLDGWVTGVPVNRDGEALVTTWDYLILPSGEQLAVEHGINNLAW